MAPVFAEQELEADYMGFVLGARSGYDPEAMLRMLHKLHAEPTPAFAMHPAGEERIRRAQVMLQTARRINEMGIPGR